MPAPARVCWRKKYGSVPCVAATRRPRSWAGSLIGESRRTTIADHSGRLYTSIALIGEPFARASSAGVPAVDPMSTTRARRFSLALLLPWESTHWTEPGPNSCSNQPCSLITRLSGL